MRTSVGRNIFPMEAAPAAWSIRTNSFSPRWGNAAADREAVSEAEWALLRTTNPSAAWAVPASIKRLSVQTTNFRISFAIIHSPFLRGRARAFTFKRRREAGVTRRKEKHQFVCTAEYIRIHRPPGKVCGLMRSALRPKRQDPGRPDPVAPIAGTSAGPRAR